MILPNIGTTVHFSGDRVLGYFPQHLAAIITEVQRVRNPEGYEVSLCVLAPAGMIFVRHVEHDEEEKKIGTWHFIEVAAIHSDSSGANLAHGE